MSNICSSASASTGLSELFSGGVNRNEVVLRRGLGLVQMTKRHKIEFPEHSQHFEKKSAKKGPKQYQMKCHERLSLNV